MRAPEKCARNRQSLLFAAGYFHSPLSDHRIESVVGAGKQGMRSRLLKDIQTFGISRARAHEQQVLSYRARKELRILCHESDSLTQAIEVDHVARITVVQDPALLLRIQSDEQFHERRLACA